MRLADSNTLGNNVTARIALRRASSPNGAAHTYFLATQYHRAQDLADEWKLERAGRQMWATRAVIRNLIGGG